MPSGTKDILRELKGNIKRAFRRKGFEADSNEDADTTRASTSSNSLPLTGAFTGSEDICGPGASLPRALPPPQIPMNALSDPQVGNASNLDNKSHQSLPPTKLIEGGRLGMTRPDRNTPGPAIDMVAVDPTAQDASKLQDTEQTSNEVAASLTKSDEANFTKKPALLQMPPAVPVSDTTSAIRQGLKEFAIILAPFTGLFGPVKEMVQVAGEAQVEYDGIRARLKAIIEDLKGYFGSSSLLTMTASMESICGSIKAELERIQDKLGRSVGVRYLAAPGDADAILACYRRVELDLQRLSLNANWEMLKDTKEQAALSRVDRLSPSLSARYNSKEAEELKRQACTAGTRAKVLDTVLDWAHTAAGGSVYWLNGMAGTGKTTISYSMCDKLKSEHKLAASFFCSRLRDDCRVATRIIPSIAYQLAQFSVPFLSILSATLEKDRDVHSSLLQVQFEELIAKPLHLVKDTLPEGLVIVIDALDECENKESTGRILDILLNKGTDLPIKFLVSSRPESEIRDRMTEERVKSRLVLHELGKGEVQADIEKYLREGLSPMSPSEENITELVARAGVLFIYAATAVRYIGYDNFQSDPQGRLGIILGKPQVPKPNENEGTDLQNIQDQDDGQNDDIDQLYRTILEAGLVNRRLPRVQQGDMRKVLFTVVCAREPLTVAALSELLQIKNPDRVRAALRPFWSVLHVVGMNELVTTLHASFPDFMFNPARSGGYHCDPLSHNQKLAVYCFELIAQTRTQLNICGFESSYMSDDKVPSIEERVKTAVPMELLYACRSWADHVEAGECASSVIGRLRDFLCTELLLWMEVLNLNKQMKTGVKCMELTVKWYTLAKDEQELIELAQDAKRFVDAFASNPVSQSTPHIYVSMLAFWPKSSPISKYYTKYTKGLVMPEGTALDRRQLAHLSTWAFESGVRAMAVSPDGLLLALGVGEEVVVLDSSSGRELLHRLKGHQNGVRSVAFSLDGARIFSGSINDSDATVLAWDTRSGDAIFGPVQLGGHTGVITCLGFSPDCTRVITGSADCTVRLWDSETGTTVSRLTAQSQSSVMTAVFTPNGNRIFARLLNGTVHTWDAQDNDINLYEVTGIGTATGVTFSPDESRIISYYGARISIWDAKSHEKILGLDEGSKSTITCIGCSPDGRYIVSGSDDRTVCVWDAQTSNIVLGPLQAHTGYITSVAFTPDGSRIISACTGGLVCTWDAQQRTLTPSSTSPPFHPINCAKFSSDGTCFVSGSQEGTISIWDAQTGEMRVGPIKAHTSYIYAVDFLNDRAVSGAEDGTICICDALTGKVVLGPLQLDAGRIYAIRYSLDGQMIATGSKERVDVWNGQNGNRVLGPLTGLDRRVVCVQFSPDGTRILASSWAFSSNIAVWDVSTGQLLFGTLDGHRNWVSSVSYSPNGALIASGSWDNTIIVWDAYTGEKRLGPPTAHSSSVLSVHFSPDSTRLVSGSDDRRIRMWDVETGEMVFELLHGHEGSIESVEYSPDGTRILSLSYGESVRIHDARSPSERALSRSESEVGDWTMNKDGWVVDDQSRLLVWVPGDLRKTLMWPSTLQVRVPSEDYLWLKFDKSRLGESWAAGYTSGM